MHTAIIIDDHPLMAAATKDLIEKSLDVSVLALTRSGEAGLDAVDRMHPDLLLLDYRLPDMDGSDVAERVRLIRPDTQVIIFSGSDLTGMVPRLVELQVSGIISKETPQDAIVRAVSCVLDGFVVLPQEGIRQLLLAPQPVAIDVDLTDDEATLMTYIVKGYTLDQIADAIHMSKRSVDNYQRRIYDKIGVKNRAQAIEAFTRTRYYIEQMAGD